MRLDHQDDTRRRRSRLGAQAFTSTEFETRVKYFAVTKKVPLPVARGICSLWDRLEREHGTVDPQVFAAAVLDEADAGKAWARQAATAYQLVRRAT